MYKVKIEKMFKNYIKAALRAIAKNRVYSSINILGFNYWITGLYDCGYYSD